MATALSDLNIGRAVPWLPLSEGARAREVLVVGAGLGGLAAAVRLAAHGYRVRVLERGGVDLDGGPLLWAWGHGTQGGWVVRVVPRSVLL